MKIVLSTISVSPHLTSFRRHLARSVPDSVYAYHDASHDPARKSFGWDNETAFRAELVSDENRKMLETVPVLIESMRDVALIERRLASGLATVYMSERWLTPPLGLLRLCHPRYFRMVRRFCRCLENPKCCYLAQGVHAARDMARLCGLFKGDWRCLFRTPKVEFENKPLGRLAEFPHIRIWGYFVEPSVMKGGFARQFHSPLKVLWVGRMLDWKRTITIIEAVKRLENVTLTVVGEGPDGEMLKSAAKGCQNIQFHKFVKADRVRELMREHDVYILSSDGGEGWGATLNEAMEEGMCVFGTYEAGASATMLSKERLYHAGDVDGLVRLLKGKLEFSDIGEWRADRAAKRLVSFLAELEQEDAK